MFSGTGQQSPWYSGATRQERIAEAIARNGFDVLLALTPENAAYLSGRTGTIATLWRLPGLVAVATDADGRSAVASGDNDVASYTAAEATFSHPLWIEHLDLRQSGSVLLDRVVEARSTGALDRPAQFDPELMLNAVTAAVGAVVSPPRRVGTELSQLPAWVSDGLQRRLPGTELIEAVPVFDDLRAIKDNDEIAHLRLSAELTVIGIAAARDALSPGMNALGVSAAYQRAIWAAAANDIRFSAMRQVEGLVSVGDGSGAALVGPGETVKLDMQVDVGGYHSDIGRTYALNATAEQQQVYDALNEALDVTVGAVGPGVPFRDVWAAGTAAMRSAGFANYSRGHLGHSVGLAHNYEEPPFISQVETRPIAPGMVLSVELPYYLLGVGSFQMERMMVISETGAEVLDQLPFALSPEVNDGENSEQ
jgi:Xaa-Pro aminopeptidase